MRSTTVAKFQAGEEDRKASAFFQPKVDKLLDEGITFYGGPSPRATLGICSLFVGIVIEIFSQGGQSKDDFLQFAGDLWDRFKGKN